MKAQRRYNHRPAIAVISRVIDVLHSKRWGYSPPKMERVISLDNTLTAVIETAIAEQKAMTTEREVSLMIARDAIRNKNQTGAIEFSIPSLSVPAGADLRRLVDFRIRERFVPAFVPSPPAEQTHPTIKRLLEIATEPILDRCPQGMSGDIRHSGPACQKIIDRFSIASHVGVIDETKETDNSFPMPKHRALEFDLDIFCPGPAHFRIEVNAVGHFRHQRFRKSYRPAPLMKFEHRLKRESSRVGRVVVRAVVVHGPVHELETGVRTVAIVIEEIRHAELPKADLEPALGKRRKKRERRTGAIDLLVAKRNHLVPHESSDVRCFAQVRIPHDIQIGDARQTDSLTNAMAAGFLNVAEQFSPVREPHAREKREDSRSRILRLRRQAPRALIGRVKCRMPL